MKTKRAMLLFLIGSALGAMALLAVARRALDMGAIVAALPFAALMVGLLLAARRGFYPRGALIGAAAGAWIGFLPHLMLTLVHRWIVEPVGMREASEGSDFGRVTVPLFWIGAMILGGFVGRARARDPVGE